MKIYNLKASFTDAEATQLASNAIPEKYAERLQEIQVIFLDQQVEVRGKTQFNLPLFGAKTFPFTLLCGLSASSDGQNIVITIEQVQAKGIPGFPTDILLPTLLKNIPTMRGIHTEGQSILLSPSALLAQKGIQLEASLCSIDTQPGELTIEF